MITCDGATLEKGKIKIFVIKTKKVTENNNKNGIS